MIPRGKLDITFTDLFAGIYYCLFSPRRSKKDNLSEENRLICLSVRTGFDLVLTALNLPAGSEIIVTGINIPDMFSIIAAHGLKAVPVPVNKHTLNISPEQVEAAITHLTKAILITHLFGGIVETGEVISIAKKHDLLVLEDRAQAYAGNEYIGNAGTDVVMFSFGFIKTHTTLTGGMLLIKDRAFYDQVTHLNSKLPRQPKTRYLKKILKAMAVKLLTQKEIYTLFYYLLTAAGKNIDAVLSTFTKGFPGNDILKSVRYRPCEPNERLIERRLKNFKPASINRRKKLAADVLGETPGHFKIGEGNQRHTFWVLPVETQKPAELIAHLRANGFDVTQKASSLVTISKKNNSPGVAELDLEKLVYLPVYPGMSNAKRKQLAGLLTNFD